MKGQVSEDVEVVGVDADMLWDVYGSTKLGMHVNRWFPNMVQVVEGDGGVGTVSLVTFPSDNPEISCFKEKYTKIDNERRLKVAEVVEGTVLLLGFSLYRICFEIIEKKDDKSSSIIRSTIEYETDEEIAANDIFVDIKPLQMMGAAIGRSLLEKKVYPDEA